jgi:hypothetical protein
MKMQTGSEQRIVKTVQSVAGQHEKQKPRPPLSHTVSGIESIPFFGWSHRLIVYLITSRQMMVRRNAHRAPPAYAIEARSPLPSSKDDTRHEQSEA